MPDPSIDPQKPGPVGLAVRSAGHGPASRCADRDRLVDGQLLPASLGHRLLGTGLRRLGLSEPDHGLRISAPGRFEYRSVDSMVNPYLMGSAHLKAFDDGIDQQARSGRAGRAQHLRGDGRPASRSRSCRCPSVRRSSALEQRRGHQVGHARRDVPVFTHYKTRRMGTLQSTPSPTGTWRPTWDCLP